MTKGQDEGAERHPGSSSASAHSSAAEVTAVRRAQMFTDYRATHDLKFRDDLVREYTPLVNYLAFKFVNRGQPLQDLRQVAFMGLLKAIERFKVETGANFRTYACPTIVGEMLRYMRDKTWLIKVPRRLLELRNRIHLATDALTAELGRIPRPDEIALRTHLVTEDVIEVGEMEQAWAPKSLDSRGKNEEAGQLSALVDSLLAHETPYEDADRRLAMGAAMRKLTPREQTVLLLRFYGGHTQLEIGALIHVSQMQVSRILRHALDEMRAMLEDGGSMSLDPAVQSQPPPEDFVLSVTIGPLPANMPKIPTAFVYDDI